MSSEKKGSKIHVFVINDVKNEEWEKEELDDTYNADGDDTPKGGSPNDEDGVGGDKQKVINSKKNKKKEIIRHKMYHPQVKIVKVSCGKSIIGFLSVVGKIYCWQLNGFEDFDKNVPYLLVDPVLKNKIIYDVSSGDSHIAFISKEGDLFTYGDNTYGQLGKGDDTAFDCEDGLGSTRDCTPDSTSETVHSFSTLQKDVGESSNPEEVGTRTKKKKHEVNRVHKVDVENNIVKYVYSRDRYTLYLTIDGLLYGFGLINENFIQGEKNKDMRKKILTKPCLIDTNNIAFKKIAIGNDFILGISFNNLLYSWGDNTNGVLGFDDCAESHEPKLVDSLKNVTYVSAGKVSLCKTMEDDLYIWGGTYGCKPSMVKNKFSQMIINKNFIIGLCAKKNIWVKKIDTLSHGYYINNLKIDLLCSYDNLIIGVENHAEGEVEPVHADAKLAIESGSIGKGKGEGDELNYAADNDEACNGVDVADDAHGREAHLTGGNVPPQQGKGADQAGSPNDIPVSTVPTEGKVPPSDVKQDVAEKCDAQGDNEDSCPNEHLTGEEAKSNGIPQVGSKSGSANTNQFECDGMTNSDAPKVDSTNGSYYTETKSHSWNSKENTTHETDPEGNTYHKLIDAEREEEDYSYGDYDDDEGHFLATNFYGKPEIANQSDVGAGITTNTTAKGKEKVNLKSALKKFPSSERLKKSVSFSNYVYDFAKSNYELMSGVSSGEETEATDAMNPSSIFQYDAPRGREAIGSECVNAHVGANNAATTTHPPDEDIFVHCLEKIPNMNPSEDKLNSQFIWDDPPQECTPQETSLNEEWDKGIAGQTIGGEVKMYVGSLHKEEELTGDKKYVSPLINDSNKIGPMENFPSDSDQTGSTKRGGAIDEEHSYNVGGHKGGFTFDGSKWGSGFDWNGSGKNADNFGAKLFLRSGDKNGKTDAGSLTSTVNISLRKKNHVCAKWKALQKRKQLKIKYHIYKKVKCGLKKKMLKVENDIHPIGTKLTLLHPSQVKRKKMTKLKRTPAQFKEEQKDHDNVDSPFVESNHVNGTNAILPSDICQCCGGRSTHSVNLQVVMKKDSTYKKGDAGGIPLEDSCTKKKTTSMSVNKKASICENNPSVKDKNKKKSLNSENGTKMKTSKTGKKQVLSRSKDKSVCSNKSCASKGGPFCITCTDQHDERGTNAKVNVECMKQPGEGAKNTQDASIPLGFSHPIMNVQNCSVSRCRMDSCDKNTSCGQHFPPKRSISAGGANPRGGEGCESCEGNVDMKLCRKTQGVKKDTSRCHSEGEMVTRSCSEVVKKRSDKQKGGKLPGEKKTHPLGGSHVARIEYTSDQDLCNYHGGDNALEANSQMVLHDNTAHTHVEAGGNVRTSPKKKLKRRTSEGALCLYNRCGSNDTKVAVPKKGKQNGSGETLTTSSNDPVSNCNRKIGTRSGSKGRAKGGKMTQAEEEQDIACDDEEEGKKKQKRSTTTKKLISVDSNESNGRDVLKKLGRQIRRMKNDIAVDKGSGKGERGGKGRVLKGEGGYTGEIELIDEDYSRNANKECDVLFHKLRGKLRGDHADAETTLLGKEKKRMKKLLKDVQYIYEEYKYIKKEKEENEKKKNYLKKVLENTVMKTNQVIRLNKNSFQVYIDKMRKENLFLKNELDEESHQHHYDLQQLANKITHLEKVKDIISKQNEEFTKRNMTLTIECEKYKREEVEMRNAVDNYKQNLENEKKKKKYILRKIEHSLKSWETEYNELKDKYNSMKAQNEELLKRSDELAKRNDDLVQRNDDLADRNDDLAERNEQLREEARALRRELNAMKELFSGNSAQVDALSAKGSLLKRDTTSALATATNATNATTATTATTNNSALEDLSIYSSSGGNAKRTHGTHPLSHKPREQNKSRHTEEKQVLHLEQGSTPKRETLSTHFAILKDKLKQRWKTSKQDDFLADPILEGIVQMALKHLEGQNEARGSEELTPSNLHLSTLHANGEDTNASANMVNTTRADEAANSENSANRESSATPRGGEDHQNENLEKAVMEEMEETMTSLKAIKGNYTHDNEGEATTQQVQGNHFPSNETTESKTGTYDTLSSEMHVDSDDSVASQTSMREGELDTEKKNSTKAEAQKWVTHKMNYTSADLTELTHTTHNVAHSDLANGTNGANGGNAPSGVVEWGDDDGEASQTDERHMVHQPLERKKKKKKKKKLHSATDSYNDGETDETNEHPFDERLLKTKIRGLNEKSAAKGEGVTASTSPSNEVTTKALAKKNTQLKEIQKNDFLLLHDANSINKNNTFDPVATANDAATERKKVVHGGDGKIVKRAITDAVHKQSGPADNSKEKKKELNAMLDSIFDTSSDHSSINANMVSIQSLIESNLKNIFSAQD
ncbi:hypothetical protein AK88_01684 [Plasmodium fragile]|uniref:Regulator of chromosome condensation n=1 Tax=Plasmodium fragile TaxID=5857 RepID=A0A0D9QNJ4_PLAFR|nr:uncharacterized protein AK88_01684 [Plasmodium fragile]KJP88604.1 hypothetical protein AK88_01684 [Plasmodium fragile]